MEIPINSIDRDEILLIPILAQNSQLLAKCAIPMDQSYKSMSVKYVFLAK